MKQLMGVSALAIMAAGAAGAADLKLVEVITSPARTETLQTMISAWEAETGHSVEIVSLPWGQAFEKLATMVAGGDVPDLVEMPDRWLALYSGSGRLMDLTDRVANWEHGDTLTEKALAMGRQSADGTLREIPYGFYLRAMFYNKDLLREAGVDGPPETMEEFMQAAAAVSELDGKSGYCLRGGPGGLNAWIMMAAAMNGTNAFFTEEGESRINEPGSVEGLQFLIDMYQEGHAPRDSVGWGFNEIAAGFYSGTCTFLDQDPDALIAVSERMDPDSFAVAPMPRGPSGQAFPTIGYAGWAAFESTEHLDASWDLIAHLSAPQQNETWAKQVGVIPVHEGAEDPYFQTEQFSGWFTELNDPAYVPTIMPSYLEGFGYFADSVALDTSKQALLGEITAQEMADQWAELLSEEYEKWEAAQ